MEIAKEEYEEGLLKLGKLVFDFAKVHRATYHDDGITPESDTDHTVMVGVVACSLADVFYKDLDMGKIARYALVHDIVEVYAGDTSTFNISGTGRKEKEYREKRAFHLIEDMFSLVYPWTPKEIALYEAKEDKESRFVKAVDKLVSHISHILNNGMSYKKRRIGVKEVKDFQASYVIEFEKDYGEFPEIINLLKLLSQSSLQKLYD